MFLKISILDDSYFREQVLSINRTFSSAIILCVSPNGFLISGQNDYSIKIWNPNNGSLIQDLKGHTDKLTSIILLQDKYISSSNDNTTKIWSLNGTLINSYNCQLKY